MPRTYTSFTDKFDAISNSCLPQPFLRLAATARDFISVASWLADVRDESEFQMAFSRFIGLQFRFYGAFQDAYDMGLLANADEATRPCPRELRELDRALGNQESRVACLVTVCRLAEATACLVGVRRFPNYHFPWAQMFDLLLEQPLLAPLFREADLDKWKPLRGESEKRFAALAHSSGFRRIAIKPCCDTLLYEAGELWAASLMRGLERDGLEEAASRMRRLANFLRMPAQEPWILQEFISIGSTDSLQAVLQEVLRYDLRRVTDLDNLDRDKLGEYGPGPEAMPANTVVLTSGLLKKRKYLLALPDLRHFADRLSSEAFEEASVDPIGFLRKRWRKTPQSLAAEHCQQQLVRMENAILDLNFRHTMEHVTANLAGEAFAYAVSSSLGTSPEVSIFIAGCFGVAVDVMMALRKG